VFIDNLTVLLLLRTWREPRTLVRAD